MCRTVPRRVIADVSSSPTGNRRGLLLVALCTTLALPLQAGDPPALLAPVPNAYASEAHTAALDILGLTGGDVQALALPASVGEGLLIDVVLDGASHTLRLWPHSVRAPGFQLFEVGADGEWRSLVPPPPSTVRGEVVGMPGSRLSGVLENGALSAQVIFPDGRMGYGIEPLPGSPLHVAWRDDAYRDDPLEGCGNLPEVETSGLGQLTQPGNGSGNPAATAASASTFPMMAANIAGDVDVESYTIFGSVPAAMTHVETIINGDSDIFETQVGMRLDLSVVVVRTAEPDPYVGKNGSSLVGQVDQEWMNPPPGIDVDAAQLFVGKNMPGLSGAANGAGVCTSNKRGSVVETFAWSTTKRKIWLSSHEMGHLFGAAHCSLGTNLCGIMCTWLCNPQDVFGPAALDSFLLHKFGKTCFDLVDVPLQPHVTDVSPGVVNTFQPSWITVTGQGFTFTSELTVDGEPVNPFFVKVISDAELTFLPPKPEALGSKKVTITAPGGHTTPFVFTVASSDSPVLLVNSKTFAGFSLSWSWGGPARSSAALLLSLSPETVTASGHHQLADVVRWVIQPLDDLGLGGVTVASVPAAAAGLSLHSQVLTFDDHGPTGVSEVSSTDVLDSPFP